MTPLTVIETASAAPSGSRAIDDENARPKDGAFAKAMDDPLPDNGAVITQEGADLELVDDPLDMTESELVMAEPVLRDKAHGTGQMVTGDKDKALLLGKDNRAVGGTVAKTDTNHAQDATYKGAKNNGEKPPEFAGKGPTTMAQTVLEGRLPNNPPSDIRQASPAKMVVASETKMGTSPAKPGTLQATAQPAAVGQSVLKKEIELPLNTPFGTSHNKSDMQKDSIIRAATLETHTIPQPIKTTTPTISTTGAGLVLQHAVPDIEKQVLGLQLAEAELLPGTLSSERLVTHSQTVTGAPQTAGAETGRQVAQQIAVAITNQQGRATEIALNPEELGRVRMSMTAQDTSIVLTVLADRPETTDLLRRHIDTLAQEFRALGYDNITFSFGGDEAQQDQSQSDEDHQATIAPETLQTQPNPIMQPTSGLDLRL